MNMNIFKVILENFVEVVSNIEMLCVVFLEYGWFFDEF